MKSRQCEEYLHAISLIRNTSGISKTAREDDDGIFSWVFINNCGVAQKYGNSGK
jgi:hypothetical protein